MNVTADDEEEAVDSELAWALISRAAELAFAIKNCCFDSDNAYWLLNHMGIATHLLYPLAMVQKHWKLTKRLEDTLIISRCDFFCFVPASVEGNLEIIYVRAVLMLY